MNPTHNRSVVDPAGPGRPDIDLTPADVLRGAASYLQSHGWHQHDLYAPNSGVPFPPACAIGAIYAAAFGHPTTSGEAADHPHLPVARNAIGVLADHLTGTGITPASTADPDALAYADQHGAAYDTITAWNDTDGQTGQHVIRQLRLAATGWDNQHRAGTR
jgi:membrane-bound lytic murein transglycosylase B